MDVDNDDQNTDTSKETDIEREQRALKLKAEGNKKYSSKNYEDAISLYTQAITAYPRPEFYGNRAASYIAIHQFKQALSDCLSSIKLDPKFRKAYIRGIKCYTELAQLENAQQLAKDGLNIFPNDKDLKQGYDRVDIIRNKLSRINDKLTKISLKYDSFFEAQLSPKDNDNNNNNNDNDNDKDMKDNKEEEEEEKQELPSISHKLSKQDSSEVDIAISMIKSLLSNDLSQSIDLKCLNIRAYIIKQNYDIALSNATNLLRWHKDNNKVTELRAIALFRSGNADSAIKHLQQILRKDPDNKAVKTLYKLFKCIGRTKDAANKLFKSASFTAALSSYCKCLLLDPTNLKFNCVIYSNIAAVYLKKKEWSSAYSAATIAIDLDSLYIKAYGRRLQALYGLERYDEAVGDAEKALNLDPTNNDLKQQLRDAKIELKKSKRKNYYTILGVEKDATEKEIKKGFRKKAMIWHPDKFASEDEEHQKKAEEKFKEIGEAYEVLKDPKMKQRYDSGVDIDQLKSGGFGFPGGGVDISHIFDLLGGMGGHPGGGHGHHAHGHPGFQQHFSSGGHGHQGHGGNGQSFTFRFG